jgi:hypothetical protein
MEYRLYCQYENIYCRRQEAGRETTFSVLEPYLNLWHYVYQDNYYNIVETEENVILRKTRVCGTIRANRGIPFKN